MSKVLVNFPDEFLKDVDRIAELEHRTRSSLIREALRRYIAQHKQKEEALNEIKDTPIRTGLI